MSAKDAESAALRQQQQVCEQSPQLRQVLQLLQAGNSVLVQAQMRQACATLQSCKQAPPPMLTGRTHGLHMVYTHHSNTHASSARAGRTVQHAECCCAVLSESVS